MQMIDRLRQLKSPSTETAGRYRKISGCHTKGYACLMDEKVEYSVQYMDRIRIFVEMYIELIK